MANKVDLEQLFFEVSIKIIKGIDDSFTLNGEVLKIHLMTEVLLENVIGLLLSTNAPAVLDLDLKYSQKLKICAKLLLDDGSSVLSSDIIGSLKKLNALRNDIAHNLEFELTDDRIEELFVGKIGKERAEAVLSSDMVANLISYKTCIYVEMLNPELKT